MVANILFICDIILDVTCILVLFLTVVIIFSKTILVVFGAIRARQALYKSTNMERVVYCMILFDLE